MILDTIVEKKQQEVALLKRRGLAPPEGPVDGPRGFSRALTEFAGVAVIAEAKKASPSKGVILADFDPVLIAESYRRGGARAMSVLTDVTFFQGALHYIPLVRAAVDLPVLRKDFLIDPIQIRESVLCGADAVLLIAAVLDRSQLRDFRQMAEESGLDVLVEVHDEREVEAALEAGSRLIGINNRNLRDFSVDLETTFRLKREIPDHIPVVSESGIRSRDDIRRLQRAGITAALIGEALMRAGSRSGMVRQFHDT